MKYPRYVLLSSANYEEKGLFGDAIAVANELSELERFMKENVADVDEPMLEIDYLKDDLCLFDTKNGMVKLVFLYSDEGGDTHQCFANDDLWRALINKSWSPVHFGSHVENVWVGDSAK